MSSNLRKRRGDQSSIATGPNARRRRLNIGLPNVKVDIDTDSFFVENATRHHTNFYEDNYLVFRRGGRFKIVLTFEGAIKFSEILKTVLRFSIESKLEPLDNTFKICRIVKNISDSRWHMGIVEKDESKLSIVLEVNIPVTAMIGRYSVDIMLPGGSSKLVDTFELIVLFNPWNKDDEVYLDDEKFREEYVLNDYGAIYCGSVNEYYKNISPIYWNFGQFEESILDCVLELLDKYKQNKRLPLKTLTLGRTSSVWISRVLSAVLNSQDDNGVLEGNWSGDYEGGASPTSWNGSVAILSQYYKTRKPVKYGQCWVFSGIMTTALRALGIPARSVTNFESAHDTDNTMTIDSFYDSNGDRIEDIGNDSVWNFHVWNEIWTKRKDLPGDTYDGWQAVDATPQEESFNLYQMGPAPLKAVKEGEIYAGYDTGFVYGEVNADRVKWIADQDEDGEYIIQRMSKKSTRNTGMCISTKEVGWFGREDITHLYKYAEGSKEERKSFQNAYNYGKRHESLSSELNVEEEGKDLTIDLSITPAERIEVGETVNCVITVKNTSNRKITVNLSGVVRSMIYSGKPKMLVKSEKINGVDIDPGKSVTREIQIKPEEYLPTLTAGNNFGLVVVAKVLNTGKSYVDDTKFQLSNNESSVNVNFPSTLKKGKRGRVKVTFTNHLPILLTKPTFTLEGPRFSKKLSKSYSRRMRPGAKITATFYVKPRQSGKRNVLVDVDCPEVKDFKGVASVNVA